VNKYSVNKALEITMKYNFEFFLSPNNTGTPIENILDVSFLKNILSACTSSRNPFDFSKIN